MNDLPSKGIEPTFESVVFTQENTTAITTGNRIPKDYFVTKGIGESDITTHAGSYHLALKKSGIEMCNIITYSSILPKIATEISRPTSLTHGSVMEAIMAVSNCPGGERATAGIIYGWLHNKKTGKKFGGLVCEHNGSYSEPEVTEKLNASLEELYVNGFSDEYDLKNISTIKASFVPKKKFGTVIVAICFVNYIYPIIKSHI